jgi:hypothetical protein
MKKFILFFTLLMLCAGLKAQSIKLLQVKDTFYVIETRDINNPDGSVIKYSLSRPYKSEAAAKEYLDLIERDALDQVNTQKNQLKESQKRLKRIRDDKGGSTPSDLPDILLPDGVVIIEDTKYSYDTKKKEWKKL